MFDWLQPLYVDASIDDRRRDALQEFDAPPNTNGPAPRKLVELSNSYDDMKQRRQAADKARGDSAFCRELVERALGAGDVVKAKGHFDDLRAADAHLAEAQRREADALAAYFRAHGLT